MIAAADTTKAERKRRGRGRGRPRHRQKPPPPLQCVPLSLPPSLVPPRSPSCSLSRSRRSERCIATGNNSNSRLGRRTNGGTDRRAKRDGIPVILRQRQILRRESPPTPPIWAWGSLLRHPRFSGGRPGKVFELRRGRCLTLDIERLLSSRPSDSGSIPIDPSIQPSASLSPRLLLPFRHPFWDCVNSAKSSGDFRLSPPLLSQGAT